jgi:hypothetical protein
VYVSDHNSEQQQGFLLNINIYIFSFSTSFLVMDGHMMRIFSVLYLPNDDHVFLSGGWDDTLQVRNPTISLIIQT